MSIALYQKTIRRKDYLLHVLYLSVDAAAKGFTMLVLSENEDYNKILEVLDRALILLGNVVRIAKILVWRPGVEKEVNVSTSRNQVSQI